MHVRIFTNEVAGGWLATDLDTFLGGSEECVVLLAEALVRQDYAVTVYHSNPAGENTPYEKEGVKYTSRESVRVNKGDILISFKNNLPWLGGEKDAGVKIHWSSDVERPWDCSDLDYFVHLTQFHRVQNLFVPDHINAVVPHGVNVQDFKNSVEKRIEGRMLYCSSPDRGLLQLLNDWPGIKRLHPDVELVITYGFKNLKLMGDPDVEVMIKKLCGQEGVSLLGQLSAPDMIKEYQKARYWVLPLQIPSAELFCLNAIKAQLCGCVPIVNHIGALKNTVDLYIPYADFIKGSTVGKHGSENVPIYSWDQVVKSFWIPMFEKKYNGDCTV
jgi:glycosyltransferase involved in cell wall biosynthesis